MHFRWNKDLEIKEFDDYILNVLFFFIWNIQNIKNHHKDGKEGTKEESSYTRRKFDDATERIGGDSRIISWK